MLFGLNCVPAGFCSWGQFVRSDGPAMIVSYKCPWKTDFNASVPMLLFWAAVRLSANHVTARNGDAAIRRCCGGIGSVLVEACEKSTFAGTAWDGPRIDRTC